MTESTISYCTSLCAIVVAVCCLLFCVLYKEGESRASALQITKLRRRLQKSRANNKYIRGNSVFPNLATDTWQSWGFYLYFDKKKNKGIRNGKTADCWRWKWCMLWGPRQQTWKEPKSFPLSSWLEVGIDSGTVATVLTPTDPSYCGTNHWSNISSITIYHRHTVSILLLAIIEIVVKHGWHI